MRTQVVVIGAGLMGAAAAWALSARGHAVVVLEARRAGRRDGSSHGGSRVFRRACREPHSNAVIGLAPAGAGWKLRPAGRSSR